MSLLNTALKIETRSHRKPYSMEELELCIAYLKGQITLNQISKATEISPGNVYSWVLTRLKDAYTKGLIK